jgi:chromosome partitioning protein
VLTECWLREADFCLSPAKPDYLSTRGLQFLQQFGERDTEMGFAENLGVVISMKDAQAPEDEQFDRWLRHNLKARCFKQAIPRTTVCRLPRIFPCACGPMARSIQARWGGRCGSLPSSCSAASRKREPRPTAAGRTGGRMEPRPRNRRRGERAARGARRSVLRQ